MKRNSPFLAKLAILTFLAIAATSAFFAHKSKASISAARANVVKAEGDLRELRKSLAVAQEKLVEQPGDAPRLDTVLAGTLVRVMNERVEHGITVSSVTGDKPQASAGAASVDALSDQLTGTDLRTSRLNVRGNYDNYPMFLKYVEKLRELPVSVVYLKVDERQFELGLRAYGVGDAS